MSLPKFRAWDSEANIMIYSDHRTRKLYDVYYGFEMNEKGELECCWEGDFTESHVLDGGTLDNIMQSTGLKDKNGVDIYEGDILTSNVQPCKMVNPIKNGYGVVRFENGMFKLGAISLVTFISKMEVLGNVWENPELLEELQ